MADDMSERQENNLGLDQQASLKDPSLSRFDYLKKLDQGLNLLQRAKRGAARFFVRAGLGGLLLFGSAGALRAQDSPSPSETPVDESSLVVENPYSEPEIAGVIVAPVDAPLEAPVAEDPALIVDAPMTEVTGAQIPTLPLQEAITPRENTTFVPKEVGEKTPEGKSIFVIKNLGDLTKAQAGLTLNDPQFTKEFYAPLAKLARPGGFEVIVHNETAPFDLKALMGTYSSAMPVEMRVDDNNTAWFNFLTIVFVDGPYQGWLLTRKSDGVVELRFDMRAKPGVKPDPKLQAAFDRYLNKQIVDTMTSEAYGGSPEYSRLSKELDNQYIAKRSNGFIEPLPLSVNFANR